MVRWRVRSDERRKFVCRPWESSEYWRFDLPEEYNNRKASLLFYTQESGLFLLKDGYSFGAWTLVKVTISPVQSVYQVKLG